MSKFDTTDLMPAFKEGDESAFTQIHNEFFQPLCYFAFKIVGSQEQAEEIVSDKLFIAWTLRKNFDAKSSLKSFLYTSVRNYCLDYLKWKKRQVNVAEPDDAAADINNTSRKLYLQSEYLKEFSAEIDQLPGQYATVLKLRYFEGLKLQEIADRLQVSLRTVSTLIDKAEEALRSRLSMPEKMVLLLILNILRQVE